MIICFIKSFVVCLAVPVKRIIPILEEYYLIENTQSGRFHNIDKQGKRHIMSHMPNLIKNKSIVIFGYGSQGRSHALNLSDSGFNITICLPETSLSIGEVKNSDFSLIIDPHEAAKQAEIAAFMVPDAVQNELYSEIESDLPTNAALIFAHGLNIHYGRIKPREDLDVLLVAPMAQGDAVRRMYIDGHGIPTMIAVAQNVTGQAWQMARDYGIGIGSIEDRLIKTTFSEETETDLFAEQSLICGGIWGLITAAFDTLVEEGYSPEIAYYCCLKETKIMADMFARFGILGTFERISDTARFGALSRGPRIIDSHVKEQMKKTLNEIKDGRFMQELDEEMKNADHPKTTQMIRRISTHMLERLHSQINKEQDDD